MATQSLMQLRNLGLRSCQWLEEVGIHNAKELRACGAVKAFLKVKEAGLHPSLNLLYALEGAITNRRWTELSEEARSRLLQALDHRDAA